MSPSLLMVAGVGESTAIVYHGLINAGISVRHVIMESKVPHRQLLRRRIKKLGLGTVLGQIGFQMLMVPYLKRQAQARVAAIMQEYGLNAAPIDESQITRVASINNSATLDYISEYDPDIILVNGTRIIKRRILDAVDKPWINMHTGITPLYRGVHGGYWALANHNPEACGVTIHLVDPGIDTGGILAQALINPTTEDSFVTYPLLQVAAGINLLITYLQTTYPEIKPLAPPPGHSRLWSHPTLWGYVWRRIRFGVR